MKYKLIVWVLVLCLILTGCESLFDGEYSSVKPHEQQTSSSEDQKYSISNYVQLYAALAELVESGSGGKVISVAHYNQSLVQTDMQQAVSELMERNPIAAYAVEDIKYELGKSNGQSALAVDISYVHDKSAIRRIKQVRSMDEAIGAISVALNQCEISLVLQIVNYDDTDFTQVVERYAQDNPQYVMEVPQVTVETYPETGRNRVVELVFKYQTARDSLKHMQKQVRPVFESAGLYVSGDGEEREKYSQLYSFLMERYDYRIETSITPAYSLLRHGVGDSRAFAVVYAAMCQQAGLECLVVSGTKAGESHYWNIVCDEGKYYHVDLLYGRFQEMTDRQMTGYVWDYSAYPACGELVAE